MRCNLSALPAYARDCSDVTTKSPFTLYHNGKDHATVLNLKGEDVTDYFNITFHEKVVQVDFKKAPSFEEWRNIAGK